MLRLSPAKEFSQSEVVFEVSTDASFAPTGKNSPVGMLVQLFGCTVAWRASRTHLVCQSVCEAELVAIHEGYLLGAGIRELAGSIGFPVGSFRILTDNMAAKGLAHEGGSWRTRHFCVKAQGLRQQVALALVEVSHTPGVCQKADGFTKALPRALIEKFRAELGLDMPVAHKTSPPVG